MTAYDHLRVNDFLGAEIDARAIATALELGLVDRLVAAGPAPIATLATERRINERGLRLLIDLMAANGVVARREGAVELTPAFRAALAYRDLLHARIAFADRVWPDIHALFTPLIADLPQFMARSKTFELFRYDRCFEVSEANLSATREWTDFTTILTKYEAPAALDCIDLGSVGDVIDMGGNTGEFARQICLRNAALRATVVDLPVVCELGRRHIRAVADAPAAARIAFFPTDMRMGPLPGPADLVAFKSALHDWPDGDARRLLARAAERVRPGGRILIYERAPLDLGGRRLPYALAPDLVFLHFPRSADSYRAALESLGFSGIECRRIRLEVGFHLVTAVRMGA